MSAPEDWGDPGQLKAERDELLNTLAEVIGQACEGDDGTLDSYALTPYALGLIVLAKYGLVTITHDVGRRVIARWKP